MKTYDEESERFWASEESKEREIQSFDKEYPIELMKYDRITVLANDKNEAVCFVDHGDELKSYLGVIEEEEGSKWFFYESPKILKIIDIVEAK
jgi:hypothetical protein